jgi:hypothetical protein
MVSSKKKWTVMNPIRRRMKKRNPSSGQNGQLVHWWLLIHSGRFILKHNWFSPPWIQRQTFPAAPFCIALKKWAQEPFFLQDMVFFATALPRTIPKGVAS